MKEMRLMRSFIHDNVNSFIGAVVEPMRIVIVTEYCAKGSLYVSLSFIVIFLLQYLQNERLFIISKQFYFFNSIKFYSRFIYTRLVPFYAVLTSDKLCICFSWKFSSFHNLSFAYRFYTYLKTLFLI